MALTSVDTTGNPIKLTGTASTTEQIFGKKVYIKFVYWKTPTTVGHLVALQDQEGREIVSLRCETANESIIFPVVSVVNEIHCDDMDSGTLYIYIN